MRTRRWQGPALAIWMLLWTGPALAEKPDPGQPSRGRSFIEEFAKRTAALRKLDPGLVMICERQPCVLREDLDGDGRPDEVLQVMDRKSFAPGVAVLASSLKSAVLGADRGDLELQRSLVEMRPLGPQPWSIELEPDTAGAIRPRVRIGAFEAIEIGPQGFQRVPLNALPKSGGK